VPAAKCGSRRVDDRLTAHPSRSRQTRPALCERVLRTVMPAGEHPDDGTGPSKPEVALAGLDLRQPVDLAPPFDENMGVEISVRKGRLSP